MPEITQFKGTAPLIEPENLAENAAAVAINCNLDSGSIVPWKIPLQVASPTKGAGVHSIYRFGQDVAGEAAYWFNWQNHCDVARGPVADDASERTYFTEAGQPPRMTDIELGVGADLPSNWRVLGTPQPQADLSASIRNRGIVSITRNGATALAVTEDPIEFAVGDTFSAVIVGVSQAAYTGTFTATVVSSTMFTYPVEGEPDSPATGTPAYRYDGTAETRLYTYTWVNDLHQEGAPWLGADESPLVVTVSPGQIVTLSGFEVSPAFSDRTGAVIPLEKRLYRSNGGDYYLEAKLSPGATSFLSNQSSLTSQITLAAPYNLPPPADATGVIALENELMAMFRDQTWMPCKRGYPHAYPTDYWMDTAFPIVGHAAFPAGVIVCTTAKAYLVTVGSDPSTASMPTGYDNDFGCVARRSIVSGGGGVFFASSDGLCFASASGVQNVTLSLIGRDKWRALCPDSILGAFHDNRYFGFYDDGANRGGFILRLDTGELTWTDVHATAAYVDKRNDALYLVIANKICKWNGGADYMTMRWRSKSFQKSASGYAAAKVKADGVVTFRHFRDGALKQSRSVTNEEPFNLAGGRCRFDAFEVEGAAKVTKLHASNSRRSLM